jgi:alkaline phosphatase D
MPNRSLSRRQFNRLLAASPAAALRIPALAAGATERPWIGPQFWANPLQDWRLREGRMECFVSGGDRNVYLLTHEVVGAAGTLEMKVKVGRLAGSTGGAQAGFAGFRVGIHGRENDYRDSALYGIGLNAGVANDGRLFIGKLEESAPRVAGALDDVELTLSARPSGSAYELTLTARGETVRRSVPAEWLTGGVALVCSHGLVEESPDESTIQVTMSGVNKRGVARGGDVRFWFRDWTVAGTKVRVQEDRAWGPILFAMHTQTGGVLKLTAQMAPVDNAAEQARLQVKRNGAWQTIATSPVDALARTATFRVPDWPSDRDTAYRVAYTMDREYTFEGTVRRDPVDKAKIVVGGASCNNDFGFPHNDVAAHLQHFKPDVFAFVGDQIYERCAGYGIERLPLETATLDYLRKWYLFGWEYRELLRDTPAICMPDDHDVFHGNVWGAGGRHAEGTGYEGQDSGGYMEPAAWVNMVQRTQTSHLPDPFDPTPVEQNIGVYYTDLRVGGVSFAIVEDRKWKSAPKMAIPKARIVNGFAQNPEYDAAKDGDVAGAVLLGDRQQQFLDHWAADWSRGAWMKVVYTQTLFANVATLPPPASDDSVTGKLPILKPGGYAEGEVHTADHDSNGWPQSQRNRALRAFRRAFAPHITGDQHLGSTVQYGIDEWNDGPFAICTPAVSNIFPRRWYPAQPGRNPGSLSPRNTGEFLDGFGNKVTVHTVYNPAQRGDQPNPLLDRSPGYGIIEFERATRKITLAVWPRETDPRQAGARPAAGWPITIDQLDNGFPHRGPALTAVKTQRAGMCVQVIREDNGEVVYTLRLAGTSFTPRVFREGVYTVRVFDPDGKFEQVYKGQKASA